MEDYTFLFDIGIPPIFLLIALFFIGLLCILLTIRIKNRNDLIRSISIVLLIAYSAFVFSSTVVFRPQCLEITIQWIPFYSYCRALFGESHLLLENFLNIVLFIPLGVFLFFSMKDRGLLLSVLFAFSFSLIIESLQFILRKGECEVDDLIHNTLGCIIGFMLCKIINRKLLHKDDVM